MKELFGLFLALQLVCYLNGYQIALTSNAQIYTDEITKLVEFDLFNPEKLVQRLWDPQFNMLNWLRGRSSRHMTLNEDQEKSIYKDIKTLVALLIVFVIAVVVMVILTKTEKYRQRVRRMLQKLKKMLFYNTIIRSIDIAYLQICMTVAIQLNLRMKNSKY
jgi:hypothetical protein